MENNKEGTFGGSDEENGIIPQCVTVSVNSRSASEAISNNNVVAPNEGESSLSETNLSETSLSETPTVPDIELIFEETVPDDDGIEAENDDNRDDCEEDNEKLVKQRTIRTVQKVGCISCSAVLVLLIAIVATTSAVFLHYYRLMDIKNSEEEYFDNSVTFSDTELSEIPDGKVEIGEGEIFKDSDVFNILLIGTDDRTKDFSKNARADSIMILSLSKKDNTIRLVSLERGMLVRIPGHKNDILTHTFRYGGVSLLKQTVRSHLKLDVDRYIRVNFEMFQKLVDEVGGVDIELTEREAYGLNKWPNNNTAKFDRKIYPGINHFNGYEALQYSRLRWIDSDFKRIERQRKVLVAIKENLTDLSVSDLNDIFKDCLPYVQTDLSAVEFADLLINLPSYINNDIQQMTIPQKGTYKNLGHVNFEKNSKILNHFLYG